MRKTLLPLAAVLGWSVALAALSSFEAMDANRDGQVPAAELKAAHVQGAAQEIQFVDRNADGVLTREEPREAPRYGAL